MITHWHSRTVEFEIANKFGAVADNTKKMPSHPETTSNGGEYDSLAGLKSIIHLCMLLH